MLLGNDAILLQSGRTERASYCRRLLTLEHVMAWYTIFLGGSAGTAVVEVRGEQACAQARRLYSWPVPTPAAVGRSARERAPGSRWSKRRGLLQARAPSDRLPTGIHTDQKARAILPSRPAASPGWSTGHAASSGKVTSTVQARIATRSSSSNRRRPTTPRGAPRDWACTRRLPGRARPTRHGPVPHGSADNARNPGFENPPS